METPEHYRISKKTGFLLDEALGKLPSAYQSWQELLDCLSELLQSRRLRDAVNRMPLLDGSQLETHREIRLAHLAVAMLSSAYVWQNGESDVPQILPDKLAVPLFNLSEKLGLHPIIGHADVVLANTLLLPKTQNDTRKSIENFKLIAKFTDDVNWDSFFLITSLVEVTFAEAIPHVLEAVRLASSNGDHQQLAYHLNAVTKVVSDMQEVMTLLHKHLDVATFYNCIRPFLNGWSGSDALPNGLIYQGVSNKPFRCHGGSAAQSPTIQTLDLLVCKKHPSERQLFLKEMRGYMIREHRQFLTDLEKNSRVREKVLDLKNPQLTEAYNNLVSAIEEFRSYHISVVTRFIIIPSRSHRNDFDSLKSKGTGGQDLIPFLKDLRNSTRNFKV